MSESFSFFVAGCPQPKGSTRSFIVKNRPITTSANPRLKEWELRIAHEAQAHVPEGFCDGSSVFYVDCQFGFREPKGHAKGYWYRHTKRPDVDKLARAVLDALTGICWEDDAQVQTLYCEKSYHKAIGVAVEVAKSPFRIRREA